MSKLNKFLIWALFILATSLPLLVRYLNGAPITPLDGSYAHLLSNNSLYNVTLHLFPTILLPLILGLISFYLLTRIIKGYDLILFTITPLVITTFTTHNPAALFFPLVIGAYLVFQTNKYLALLAIPLLVFTDALAASAMVLFAIIMLVRQRTLALATIITLAASLLISVKTGFGLTVFTYVPLFGEFGSAFGYSFFILLLGLVFVVQHWRTINASLILFWLLVFVLSGYLVTLRPLVLLPLVLYAAKALYELNSKKWRLAFLKQASFLLLLCLGIFVLIMHIKLLTVATPQEELVDILAYADADPRVGAILITTTYEESARYYAVRKIVALENDDVFWEGISVKDARTFIRENDIRFIVVTPDMIRGDVWQRDEGFRFLMLNNEKFINVQNIEGYELWLVLQEFI